MFPTEKIKSHFPIIKLAGIIFIVSTILGLALLLSGAGIERDHCKQVMTQCNVTLFNVTCYWYPSDEKNFRCIYPKPPFYVPDNTCNILNESQFLTNCSYDPDRDECPTDNCVDPPPLSVTPILIIVGFAIIILPWLTGVIFCIFCFPFVDRFTSSSQFS